MTREQLIERANALAAGAPIRAYFTIGECAGDRLKAGHRDLERSVAIVAWLERGMPTRPLICQ